MAHPSKRSNAGSAAWMQDILLVGVWSSGGVQDLQEKEKMDLMHVAICTVLVPQGYYTFKGRDEDGWPHFEETMSLPALEPKEQDRLIRRALVDYFGEDPSEVIDPRSA